MGTSSLVALAGMGMIAMLVTFVGSILIAGLVLCVSFRLVVGYMPAYLRSLGVVLLTAIAVAVYVALGMILPGVPNNLFALLVAFLIGAVSVNRLLRAQDGLKIGYGKACLTQLACMVIVFVLWASIVATMTALSGGSMN
jgi:hypothetical protein